jgi:hypothetical protein
MEDNYLGKKDNYLGRKDNYSGKRIIKRINRNQLEEY